MLQIPRKVHCQLAGMNVHTFKNLQQLNRVPVLPAAFRADKAFSPLETFALATYNVMVEQHLVARERAAGICAEAGILSTRWNELRETVAERRAAGKSELLFGRVTLPGTLRDGGGPEPVLGTSKEITAEHPGEITRITISVSRVADLIRNRAAEHGIDLAPFWAAPFSAPAKTTRPRGARR